MLKEELIKRLEAFPDGTEVCIADIRKNLNHDFGDGSSVGIEPNFKVELAGEDDIKEGTKPFIGLVFENHDYDEDGLSKYDEDGMSKYDEDGMSNE